MKHLYSAIFALVLCSCGNKQQLQENAIRTAEADALIAQLETIAQSGAVAFGHQDGVLYGHDWAPGEFPAEVHS